MDRIRLLSTVSITLYENDRGSVMALWVEEPYDKDVCEYKVVIDNPPDSSEREITSMSYMMPSEYEVGINRLVQTGRCEIPCYEDKEFTMARGSLTLQKKRGSFYCGQERTGFTLDDLIGKCCESRSMYYGKIR